MRKPRPLSARNPVFFRRHSEALARRNFFVQLPLRRRNVLDTETEVYDITRVRLRDIGRNVLRGAERVFAPGRVGKTRGCPVVCVWPSRASYHKRGDTTTAGAGSLPGNGMLT